MLLAVRWQRLRRMPPWLPLRALSLNELLLYPFLGHAVLLKDPTRLNLLTRQYGMWVGGVCGVCAVCMDGRDAADFSAQK